MIGRLLDAIFGRPCPLGCGQRVYEADLTEHVAVEHAGDLW